MHIKSIAEAKKTLPLLRGEAKSIGTIHTLGALHRGHGELIKKSGTDNDLTIVTIYPNKIQLFPGHRYKYHERDDVEFAKSCGADVIITSRDEEMFSENYCTYIDQGDLHRHLNSSVFPFAGRGQITGAIRWINFVRPDVSYFGLKDLEQAILIKRAVDDLMINCRIEYVPCVRFRNGVPISSRLKDLNRGRLAQLGEIYFSMLETLRCVREGVVESKYLIDILRNKLSKVLKDFDIKYITIVSASNFRPIDNISFPFMFHICVTDGKLHHFDGMLIENSAQMETGQPIIWLDD